MLGNLYRIYNDVNDKSYIGKTYIDINKRFKQHIGEAKKKRCCNRPLYKAFNKYGIQNFHIELLGCYEEDILEEIEIRFISLYNSYVKDNGYNATLGGDGRRYLKLKDEDVITKYQELKHMKYVAKYFNCDQSIISSILKQNNVPLFPRQISSFIGVENNLGYKFESIASASRWIKENYLCNQDIETIRRNLSCKLNHNMSTYVGMEWKLS